MFFNAPHLNGGTRLLFLRYNKQKFPHMVVAELFVIVSLFLCLNFFVFKLDQNIPITKLRHNNKANEKK